MTTFLYSIIGGFVGGVLWRSFFDLGQAFTIFLLLLAGAFLGFFVFSKKTPVVFASVALFAAVLGILRFDIADMRHGAPFLEARVGEGAELTALVIDEPDERDKNTHLTVEVQEFDGQKVDAKLLAITEVFPRFSYGDIVTLSGELRKPENFESEDGRDFDYVNYLAKDGIYYFMIYPEVSLLESGQGNAVKRMLFSFKRSLVENMQSVIPEPEASLAAGLIVGAKQSLGENLLDAFRATGIIHIVVLSGYNITIVAEFFMRTLSFLPFFASLSIGALAIVLFAVMTGATATIVRASLMALLVLLARATGRTYAITRALFIAAFLMVLHNPKILVWDSSFQLSFMATLGLIHFAPAIERYFKFVPTKWQFREFATATVATQLFVLPLLMYKVGQVSLVALPVNLLVLITVPFTMLFGFLTGAMGFASTTLSIPFGWVSHLLLSYQLFVVDTFSRIPFADVSVPVIPFWSVLLMYAGIGLLWRELCKRKPPHRSHSAL